MSGQDASSERRHDFFTHDPALAEDLDGWHDAPEPSWLTDDESEGVNGRDGAHPGVRPGTGHRVLRRRPHRAAGEGRARRSSPATTRRTPRATRPASRHAAPFRPPRSRRAPPAPRGAAPPAPPVLPTTPAPPAPPCRPGPRPLDLPPSFDIPPVPQGSAQQPGGDAHRRDHPAVAQGPAAERLAQGRAEPDRWPDQPRACRRADRRRAELVLAGADAGDRLSPARGHQPQGRRRQDDDHGRARRDVRQPPW